MKTNKKLIFITLLALFLFNTASNKVQAEVADRIIAVVNNDIITENELSELLAPVLEQYKNIYSGSELEVKMNEASKSLLIQLIEDKIILQEAKKQNIAANEQDVEQRLGEVKNRFTSDDVFEQALSEQDLTVKKLKQKYREQLVVEKLIDQEVRPKVLITPLEINEYYASHKQEFFIPERINAREILVSFKNRTQEQAQIRASEVFEQIKSGADFTGLVEKYSEDTNVISGGLVPDIQAGTMLEEIDKALFVLNTNEVTPPIKTKAGFYIFKVEEKKGKQELALQDVQEKIRTILYQEKAAQYYQEWIKKLKENAYINIK